MKDAEWAGFCGLRAELDAGRRVLLLVRHGERAKIDHDDPTFGAAIPLTEEGCRTAAAFGRELADYAGDVQFRASPLRRTVMTAQEIAAGMGIVAPEIVEDDAIGNGSAFFADRLEVWRQFRSGHFFAKMTEYMTRGSVPGFAENAAATAAYERYVLSRFTARLGIFATHDVFLAAYLYGKGVKCDWTPENWPHFLDAAALVLPPQGAPQAHFVRTGLSDGIVGVR